MYMYMCKLHTNTFTYIIYTCTCTRICTSAYKYMFTVWDYITDCKGYGKMG